MNTLERVRNVLVDLDPEGLIQMGAPTDEYDGEARTIAHAIESGVIITSQYIRDVWLCSFGCGDIMGGHGVDPTEKTKVVFGMPHRLIFDEIAAALAKVSP